MRRDEFILAVERVIYAIRASKINEIIRVIGRDHPTEGKFVSEAFSVYAEFMSHYKQFSDTEIAIMRAFSILPMVKADFWSSALTSPDARREAKFGEVRWGVVFLLDHLPALVKLLKRTSDTESIVVEEVSKKGKKKAIPTERLTLYSRVRCPNLNHRPVFASPIVRAESLHCRIESGAA